jgi:rubrerythrin
MALTPNPNELLVDGYYGVPPKVDPQYGPAEGSVEWLLAAVERHATAEAGALAQYAYIADASGDPVVALVMRLILEDEERHHGLLRRIESSLHDALNWTHSATALPSMGSPSEPVPADLVALCRELIEEERTGARKMRELADAEKRVGGGLHTLLLEMMAFDSEKHARLLQFVEHRLAARPKAG